jgi:hypothetical protein
MEAPRHAISRTATLHHPPTANRGYAVARHHAGTRIATS